MSSQRISILGTESSGKTVFLAALTHALSSTTNYPHITAKNILTKRFTAGIMDALEAGEWPPSTAAGVRQNLRWIWHDSTRDEHTLHSFDCAGQDFRVIFEAESDDEINPQQRALKEDFCKSHLILLLLNLQKALDIHNVPSTNNARIDIEYAPAAAIRKLRDAGVTTYVVFTQADRYLERIKNEWANDLDAALKVLLPDLYDAINETGSPCALVSAIETEQRGGEVFPKIGARLGDLSILVTTIDAFLIKNKPIVEQQECEEQERQAQEVARQAEEARRRHVEEDIARQRAAFSAQNNNSSNSGGGGSGTAIPPPLPMSNSTPPATLSWESSDYWAVMKKAFVWEGRATRLEYWVFFLRNIVIAITLLVVNAVFGVGAIFCHEIFSPFLLISSSVFSIWGFFAELAVTIRRLHDTNRSGGYFWLTFVPAFGPFILLVFMCLESTPTANKYGPNPRIPPALP